MIKYRKVGITERPRPQIRRARKAGPAVTWTNAQLTPARSVPSGPVFISQQASPVAVRIGLTPIC